MCSDVLRGNRPVSWSFGNVILWTSLRAECRIHPEKSCSTTKKIALKPESDLWDV